MSSSRSSLVPGLLIVAVAAGALGGAAYFLGLIGGDAPEGESGRAEARAEGGEDVERPRDEGRGSTPAADLSREEAQTPEGTDESTEASEDPGPVAAFLTGTLVDPTGRPVPGAEIRYSETTFGFRPLRTNQPTKLRVATVSSDEDGRFELRDVTLKPNFKLSVVHPDFARHEEHSLSLPAAGMDMGLITLKPGAKVSGLVLGPGAVPVAGADVWFEATPGDRAGVFRIITSTGLFGGTPADGTVQTDAQGRYVLSSLTEGEGTVKASRKGLVAAASRSVELIAGRETPDVDVHLEAGMEILGVVRDSSGAPIAGATVKGSNSNFASYFATMGEEGETTGADGRFKLEGLAAGTYDLYVESDHHATGSTENVPAGTGELVEVMLQPRGSVSGRVTTSDGVGIDGFTLSLKPDFSNSPGGMRRMMGSEELEYTEGDKLGSFRAVDVEPGSYTLAAKAAGYSMTSSQPFTIESGDETRGVEIVMEVGAVITGIVVDDVSGAPIEGADVRVGETADRMGQEVRMMRAGRGGRLSAMPTFSPALHSNQKTNAKGEYRIEGLPKGAYTVKVDHEEYAVAKHPPIDLEAGEARSGVDVRMLQGGSIEGLVTGASGEAKSGDQIHASNEDDGDITFQTKTDAEGAFRIDRIPAGNYRVTRSTPANYSDSPGGYMMFSTGEDEDSQTVEVEEAKVTQVAFSLEPKTTVSGIVRSAAGFVEGASVTMSAIDGSENNRWHGFGGIQLSATTGADGSYAIEGVKAGRYQVSVKHPDGVQPFREELEVSPPNPVSQDFFLKGGVIEGKLVSGKNALGIEAASLTLSVVKEDASKTAQSTQIMQSIVLRASPSGGGGGGYVQSFAAGIGGFTGSAQSESDGSFHIPFVPPGKYRVSASHPDFLKGHSEDIEVKDDETVDGVRITLDPGSVIVVHVKDKQNRRPLAQRPVRLAGASSSMQMTDENGDARFNSLAAGSYTVELQNFFGGDDEEPVKRAVDVGTGEVVEITLDG